MRKSKTIFACQECGAQSPKWSGQCPACGQWNTMAAAQAPSRPAGRAAAGKWLAPDGDALQELSTVSLADAPRIPTAFAELDRVLGGGIVPGALVLMAGDPGIGKSTLLLQASAHLASVGLRVLYASGEESPQQVKLRAERLGVSGKGILFLSETEVDSLLAHLDGAKPSLVIVDSVQTLYSQDTPSAAGSIAQVRECARRLMGWAKATGTPILLAGHVTKDGSVAGPRALEHMVDVVLSLEGDTLSPYRLLRGVKNRFGSTNEVGVFQMAAAGLEEVPEPSLLFLSSDRQGVAGSVVTASMEGTRPLLAEVQALTAHTVFPQPRRTATGVDFGRLLLITAVLTKRLGYSLSDQDVIVNVAGGLRLEEPAADLAMALALASSLRNAPLDPWTIAIGEVGLGGEVRAVPQLARRLTEAARLGFQRAVVPASQLRDAPSANLEAIPVKSLTEAVRAALPHPSRASAASDDHFL
ncbi:MAG: DNA repair protein RadA [Chloroflexi bacterium]|nr:DNA repair protein RadA [Chloroflexota bacterium]